MTGIHCCSIGTGKVRLNFSDGVALTGLKRFRVSMRKGGRSKIAAPFAQGAYCSVGIMS